MFLFEKWYLDATDEDGRAFVGYHAQVKWGLINQEYNGYTFLPTLISALPVEKKSSFALSSSPYFAKSQLHWNALDVSASWMQLDPCIEELLLSSTEGEVRWSCTFPKANATVQIGAETFRNALGYVEKIVMTIPPWKIPIRELHWGRFLSNDHTIVWIRWVGPVPKEIIFHNGRKIDGPTITEFQLQFENYRLQLKNPRTLRKGTILSTVFSNFPRIKKIFPRSIMNLKENKWSSEGNLYSGEEHLASGNTIHELVVW